MSLRRAFSFGALQTGFSMVLSFFSIKITAVYLGPAGIGTLGQLTYFMSLTHGVLAAGLQVGLVRRTAELTDDATGRARVVSTILRLRLIVGIPAAVIIALASKWLAGQLRHDERFQSVLLVVAAALVFGLMTAVIVGCAMGAQDYRASTTINMSTGFVGLILVAALCPQLGVLGGLMALALLPPCTLLVAWMFARNRAWWPKQPLSHGFSAQEGRAAFAYVPMAIINTVGMPLLQLLIRDGVVAHSGMTGVGLLQGVMRISDMYMGIVGSAFVMYFFPRFSELRAANAIAREIKKGLVTIVPAAAAVGLAIYLLRDVIIHLIFTKEFVPMRDLFAWQMVGNTFSLTGQLFSNLLLSKVSALAMAALAAVTMLVWWLISTVLVSANGAVGATQAYAATYALYTAATAIATYFVFRRLRANAPAAGM